MTYQPRWDPFDVIAKMPHLTLGQARLPAGERGRYYPDSEVILLSDRLSQAERRVTLTHELVHQGRGHEPCATPHHEAKQEAACHRAAARLLIEVHDLARAMMFATCLAELAEELWVDVDTLQLRLRTLHPAERAILQRHADAREHVA